MPVTARAAAAGGAGGSGAPASCRWCGRRGSVPPLLPCGSGMLLAAPPWAVTGAIFSKGKRAGGGKPGTGWAVKCLLALLHGGRGGGEPLQQGVTQANLAMHGLDDPLWMPARPRQAVSAPWQRQHAAGPSLPGCGALGRQTPLQH